MKSFLFSAFCFLNFIISGISAHSLPVIDAIAPSGGLPIKVYPDNKTSGVYWYIPQSVEPWKRDQKYASKLYKSNKALTFIFRGQASVEESTLNEVANALGTTRKNLTPIAYDYSRNLVCQNVYAGSDLQWVFPKMIGNYLEVVPVSLRTTMPDLIDELSDIITDGGLACTVEVGFKGVYTSYALKMTADFNQVFDRFEAAGHAEYLWWEVDVHTMIQKLTREGVIKLELLQDTSAPQTPLDKQIQASMDDVMKQITTAIFTPALKLPSGEIAGRGKAWSLRMDYQHSAENAHYETSLVSNQIAVKDTQIGLRLATE